MITTSASCVGLRALNRLSYAAALLAAISIWSVLASRASAQTYAEHIFTGWGWQTFGTYAPNDMNRMFVGTIKYGQIDILDLNTRTVLPNHFLDISSDYTSAGNEQGLLGLAFDPNYASNGYFYVDYTRADNSIEVRRYQVLGDPLTS